MAMIPGSEQEEMRTGDTDRPSKPSSNSTTSIRTSLSSEQNPRSTPESPAHPVAIPQKSSRPPQVFGTDNVTSPSGTSDEPGSGEFFCSTFAFILDPIRGQSIALRKRPCRANEPIKSLAQLHNDPRRISYNRHLRL